MRIAPLGLAMCSIACTPAPLETVVRLPERAGPSSPLVAPPARASGSTARGVIVLRREIDMGGARDTVERFLRAVGRGDASFDDTASPNSPHRGQGGSVARFEEVWLRPGATLSAVLSGEGRRRMECRAATEATAAPPAISRIAPEDAWVRIAESGTDVWFLLRPGTSGYKILETVEAASKQ